MLNGAQRGQAKHAADIAIVQSGPDTFIVHGLTDWGRAFARQYPGVHTDAQIRQIVGAAHDIYGLRARRAA